MAGLGWALLLVLLGCAAFGALGILVGGTLRAEVILAVANLVWLILVLVGGIVVPLGEMPGTLAAVAAWLPSGALAEGLRAALTTGAAPSGFAVLVLLGGRRWRARRRSAWSAGAEPGAEGPGRGPAPGPTSHRLRRPRTRSNLCDDTTRCARSTWTAAGTAAGSAPTSIGSWPCWTVCRPPRPASCARWR